MPYYYSVVPASDQTTNASANTNTDHLRAAVAAGSECMMNYLIIYGRASAVNTISNVAAKLLRMSTASTVGSAFTPRTRSSQSAAGVATLAALTSFFTGPTIGTPVAAPDVEIGVLNAGTAYWDQRGNDDAAVRLAPGGTGAQGNIDLVSQGSASSLLFRYHLEFYERQ